MSQPGSLGTAVVIFSWLVVVLGLSLMLWLSILGFKEWMEDWRSDGRKERKRP